MASRNASAIHTLCQSPLQNIVPGWAAVWEELVVVRSEVQSQQSGGLSIHFTRYNKTSSPSSSPSWYYQEVYVSQVQCVVPSPKCPPRVFHVHPRPVLCLVVLLSCDMRTNLCIWSEKRSCKQFSESYLVVLSFNVKTSQRKPQRIVHKISLPNGYVSL